MNDRDELFTTVLRELKRLGSLDMSDDEIGQLKFHDKTENGLVRVLRTILNGVENNETNAAIYTKIKNYFTKS